MFCCFAFFFLAEEPFGEAFLEVPAVDTTRSATVRAPCANASGFHCNVLEIAHPLIDRLPLSGRVLGVDIEWPRPRVEYEQIAARFFSPQEQAALMGRPAAERHAAFFNIWTRKEAYLKARGDGISAGLDTFSVSLGAEAELLHSDEGAAEAARWQLMALAPAPGYVAALCATNDGWRPRCFSWNG